MQLRNIESGDKSNGIIEELFGFASHSDNKIDTYKCIGHYRFDFLYLALEECGIVSAMHQFKNLVASRLQRYMEVRRETAGRCNIIDNLVGK